MGSEPKNLVGVTLSGRYRVERAIGEGGMGAVFQATQLSLGRLVAIKVVKCAHGDDAEPVKRFERETEIISRLSHPNIVQVVDAGRADDGTMYLAMELIDGESVRQVLKREGSLAVGRALAIAEDVASALVAAHDSGVIHRDLKAENVMLVRVAGKSETAKVLDFGVAKVTTRTEAPPVTGSGFVAGTPGCIAPEQMLGKSDDPRSDLYSLGVLLFEMLTGQGPFTSSNAMELMMKHLTEPAPRVGDVARARGRPEVPAPVDALVASLLAKDPDERPASAEAAAHIFAALRDAGRATESDLPLPTPRPSPAAGLSIGSKVLSLAPFPSGPPSGPPSGAALAGAAPSGMPPSGHATSASAPAAGSAGTSPTTTMPSAVYPWWRLSRRQRAARVTVFLSVIALAVVGAGQLIGNALARHADRLSRVPAAEEALEDAIEAYWDLNLDRAEHHLGRALSLDPEGAAMGWVLAAQVSILRDGPMARADALMAKALDAAQKRSGLMVKETHTEGIVRALAALDPVEAQRLFDVHVENHHCYTGDDELHAQLFALKMAQISTRPRDTIARYEAVENDRPVKALGLARAHRLLGEIDTARALLREKVVPAAGSSAIVVMAEVDLDLIEGKREEAKERLRSFLRKTDDVRALARLEALNAADGDREALGRVQTRLGFLAEGSDARVDGYGLLGHLYASQGRLVEANKAWRAAVDENDAQGESIGRGLELRALAQMFATNLGDVATSRRWRDELSEHFQDLPSSDPAVERLRAFSLGGRALLDLLEDPSRVRSVRADLEKLRRAKQDVPLIDKVVEWQLAVSDGRFEEAVELARTKTPSCWSEGLEGCAWERQAEQAALAHDGPRLEVALARARERLDAASTDELRQVCTAEMSVIPLIQAVQLAHALSARARVAQLAHDVADARQAVKRFRAFWPHADEDLPDVRLVKGVEDWLAAGAPRSSP